MTTAITHDTANDFASPYADIERLPRLTAEEEARLLHWTPLATPMGRLPHLPLL